MEKKFERFAINKKEKNISKKASSKNFLTSVLKSNLAIALKNLFFGAQKFIISIALFFSMMAISVNAGDIIIDSDKLNVSDKLYVDANGNTQLQKNNEIFLNLKNTETNGKQYALVSAGSAGGIGVGKFSIYDKTADTSRLTIDASGNVGIGTRSPGALLHVNEPTATGSTFLTKVLQPNTAAGSSPQLVLGRAEADGESGVFGYTYNSPTTNSFLWLVNYGDSQNNAGLVVRKGGNVGIGTVNPGAKLHVYGVSSVDTFASFGPDATSDAFNIGYGGASYGQGVGFLNTRPTSGPDDMVFGTANTERMRILGANGNVGIGTTAPQAKLDVAGKVRGQGVTQQIASANWNNVPTESGTATSWANLPTDMVATLTTDNSNLYIDADISRVQHTNSNINTEYRIIVDGTECARTNTGGHDGWNFHSISFHCITSVAAGAHTIRVQYKTQSGTEIWYSDTNGQQWRRLTVVEYKN